MPSRIVALVVGLLAVGSLVQGCGGGENAASGTEGLNEKTFVRKADAICAAREAKLDDEVGKLYYHYTQVSAAARRKLPPERVYAVRVILVNNLKAELRELRALGKPSGGKIPIDEILAAFQGLIESTEANPRKFLATPAPYVPVEKAAEKYGMMNCPVH